MGKDPFGNSYYELPAQPQAWIGKLISKRLTENLFSHKEELKVYFLQLGKRMPTRWYDTAETNRKEVFPFANLIFFSI